MNTLRALLAVTVLAIPAVASAETVLTVQYPYPGLSRPVHEEIAKQFKVVRPDITIEYRRPTENHAESLQNVLRGAISKSMPDISFQGLHLARTLVQRGLAVPLDACLGQDTKALGYADWALEMGRIDGKIYGFPYGLTAPALFVNEDLLMRAGVDVTTPPKSWEEVIAIGKKVRALENNITGLHYVWNLTGDFMFQTLLFSKGGSMLTPDERKVAFDSPAGLSALKTLQTFGESGMPNMNGPQVNQAFVAGTAGMIVTSTAYVAGFQQQIGNRFTLKLWPFPRDKDGRLPTGGNIPIVLSDDAAKRDAICAYMRFVTGPVGQTIMVERIGYLTGNALALSEEKYLKNYVATHPHYAWAVGQLPVLTNWYALPGDNALKIMDVVNKKMEVVFTGKGTAEKVMPEMASEVQALIGE